MLPPKKSLLDQVRERLGSVAKNGCEDEVDRKRPSRYQEAYAVNPNSPAMN
jgi:hypothetical protein